MAAPTDYIAFYPLKTDANDVTGNYDGTPTNVIFDGQSVAFNGDADSHIEIPALGNITENSMTISLWLNRSVINTRDIIIGNYPDPNYLNYEVSDNDELIIYWNESDEIHTPLSDQLVADEWDNIILIRDTANNKFYTYINGAFGYEVVGTGSNFTSNSTQMIGTDKRGNNDVSLEGRIGDVRIYNYASTPQNCIDIYNEEYEEFYPPIWQSFLDISEDIAMASESFIDVSQDELPTYQIFQDISTDEILITEIFQDISIDHQGHIEIFADVSINQSDIAWCRFYDISEDIPESYPSTIIKRINE